MKYKIIIYSLFLGCVGWTSCKKSVYLDAKPNDALVVPETLSDFQALLDNDAFMNGSGSGLTPDFVQIGSDDAYVTTALNNLPIYFQDLYVWDDGIASNFGDWPWAYRTAFYANNVLDGISGMTIPPAQQTSFNNIKGSALFYRSYIFYHLAQVYAPPYDQITAGKDWGIVLRLSSGVDEKIERSTVQQTYDRIIADLKTSIPLLPLTPLYKTRPSKPAAYGALARTYLSMRDYNNALLYADSCLQLENGLLDYNTINPGSPTNSSFSRFNGEVIFQSLEILNALTGSLRVDSLLYRSYDSLDLRKSLFFTSRSDGYGFRGSYDGTYLLFSGLAIDEMYLIRAECYARTGDAPHALADLNALMTKRWVNNGSFIPYTATDAADALNKILTERRKELAFRGARWSDLRRLNKEGANITITRVMKGQTYTLPPGSLKYTYLIPPSVIGFNPNMPQNPR